MNIKFIPHFSNLSKNQIRVDERLVRGKAVTCPFRLYKMKQEGINQIIDLRNSALLFSNIEKFFCRLLGIKYLNFPYKHRANNLPQQNFFSSINKRIVNNDGKTYMHCQYGKRRTGVCTAVYEKFCTKKSKQDILDDMINIGFQDVFLDKNTPKIQKYRQILYDFIQRYFPEELKNLK